MTKFNYNILCSVGALGRPAVVAARVLSGLEVAMKAPLLFLIGACVWVAAGRRVTHISL